MDQFDKLVKDETNTDEKFSAAADFFLGLKTAGVKVRHNAANKAVASSARKESRDNIRSLLSAQKGGTVRLVSKAKGISKNPKAIKSSPGQAVAPAPTKATAASGYKNVSTKQSLPERKIKLLAAMKKKTAGIEKEAFRPFTAIGEGAAKLIGGSKALKQTASAAREGAELGLKPQKSRMAIIGSALGGGIKRGLGAVTPAPVKNLGSGIASAYRRAGTRVSNFMDPGLANARKVGQKHVDDFMRNQGTRAAATAKGPEALAAWEKGLAAAEKNRDATIKAFEKARGFNQTTGLGSTIDEVGTAIRGADGKISPSSVYKGLENLGLTSPEQLMNMGVAGVSSIQAARAARAAQKANNTRTMLLGGGAGLAGLALLKGSKNNQQPQVVVR